jgi:hypothetical protein
MSFAPKPDGAYLAPAFPGAKRGKKQVQNDAVSRLLLQSLPAIAFGGSDSKGKEFRKRLGSAAPEAGYARYVGSDRALATAQQEQSLRCTPSAVIFGGILHAIVGVHEPLDRGTRRGLANFSPARPMNSRLATTSLRG